MGYIKYSGREAALGQATTAWFTAAADAKTLVGTAASETFFGNASGVTMTGGAGDDTYYLNSKADRPVENAGEGIDTIVAWRSISLANYANIENVSVGSDDNYAVGNALDNVVSGMDGRQQIYGGLGEDILIGGAGADVFIVRKGEGNDVIQDFAVGEDKIRLDIGVTSFSELQSRISQMGADAHIDFGGGEGLILRNVTASQLTAASFNLGLDTARLGALTFSDEFSGSLSLWDAESAPNGVWRPDFGLQGSQGLGSYTLASNNEKQIYTSPYFRDHAGDFSENPFVMNSDGTMSIWARPSSNPEIFGYGYTSGALTTKESFAQTYGYFEIRADVPDAAGAWPAFWLVPNDGSWPPELDVMETLSVDPHMAWTTAHSAANGSHVANGIANYVIDTADGMHTYGTLWTPTELVYYIDRVEVFRVATPADMNKPMHMIVNMAMGGWGGDIDPAGLPAEFKIDYIRAYGLADGASVVAKSAAQTPASTPAPAPAPIPAPTPPPAPVVVAEPKPNLFTLPVTLDSNNWVHGTAGDDKLQGTDANDFMNGAAGKDTMTGGAGDDLYSVDNPGDTIIEKAKGGVDTVLSTAASFVLPANVENIRLVGSTDQSATGNADSNRLTGGWNTSTLDGGAGDDILVAGTGANILTGGAGKDIFQFDAVPNFASKITDFKIGQDMLDLRGLFSSAGYNGNAPFADGYLSVRAGAGGADLYFDRDAGGPGVALLVATFMGVDASALFSHLSGKSAAQSAVEAALDIDAGSGLGISVSDSSDNWGASVLVNSPTAVEPTLESDALMRQHDVWASVHMDAGNDWIFA